MTTKVAVRRQMVNLENCAILDYCIANSGTYSPTFPENLSVQSSMGPIGCPETSVRNYHYSLRNIPEDRTSQLFRGESLFI
jgi:hypothetical protein